VTMMIMMIIRIFMINNYDDDVYDYVKDVALIYSRMPLKGYPEVTAYTIYWVNY